MQNQYLITKDENGNYVIASPVQSSDSKSYTLEKLCTLTCAGNDPCKPQQLISKCRSCEKWRVWLPQQEAWCVDSLPWRPEKPHDRGFVDPTKYVHLPLNSE